MTIGIIGDGAWGKALSQILQSNGHQPQIYGPDDTVLSHDILMLSLPVPYMRNALKKLEFDISQIKIINTSKGIERVTHKLPYDIVNDVKGTVAYYTLVGPSFASEVVNRDPTIINLGTREADGQNIKALFENEYFKVTITNSVEALEMSAALKNVYAIASGIADALEFKTNTKIYLLMQAIKEIETINTFLHHVIDSTAYPALIGDLFLSCSSNESRNFMFGQSICKMSAEEALENLKTVEGYFTADSIPFLEEKMKISIPLARFVYQSIHTTNHIDMKDSFLKAIQLF
jgi:glycerol-3-phosphate dehydrogenase (NAD(P)+)